MGYRFHFPSAGLPTAKPVLPGLPSASIPARPVAACPPLVFRPVVWPVASAPLFGPVVRTYRSACHFGPSFGLSFRPVVRPVVSTRRSAPLPVRYVPAPFSGYACSPFLPACPLRPILPCLLSRLRPVSPRPFSGHACGPVPAGPFPHPLRSRTVAVRRLSSFRQAPGLLTALSLHLRHRPFCIGPVIATFVAASTLSQHPSVAAPLRRAPSVVAVRRAGETGPQRTKREAQRSA